MNLTPKENKKILPFVQWEKSSMTAWRKLNMQSPTATNLLTLMIESMNDVNALMMSQQTMAEVLGCSRQTISSAIKILKDGNWIDTVRVGSSTIYVVDRSVFWTQARNKRHYADFYARVIASENEQKESLAKLKKGKDLKRVPRTSEVDRLTILDDEDPPSQEEMEI